MAVDADQLLNILEASLLVAARPMTVAQLEALFEHEDDKPSRDAIREALVALQASYETRGIELVEVASGYRMQAKQEYSPYIGNLFQERAPRYSRALLETLVLIAYRQPITRGEIEDVRGVAVSSNIIKTLLEREWIRVLGHRDVPGRPAILGTTKQFLDYFNLKRIDELPTLSEIKDLDQIDPDLAREVALLDGAAEGEEGGQVAAEHESDATANGADTDLDATSPEIDPETKRGFDSGIDLEADPVMENTLDQTLASVMAEDTGSAESAETSTAVESDDEQLEALERDADGHVDVHLDLGADEKKDDSLVSPEKHTMEPAEETETLH